MYQLGVYQYERCGIKIILSLLTLIVFASPASAGEFNSSIREYLTVTTGKSA